MPRQKNGWLSRALWVAVPVLVLAGILTFILWPRRQILYTDGEHSWPAQENLDLRTVLWDEGRALEPLADLGEDYDPCLSADGRELYFTRGRAGGEADIFVAYWTHRGWSEPKPVAEVNTDADEIGPALGPDGATLYFYSDRPGGEGGYDLYLAKRDGSRWGTPVNLGPRVNSPFNDYDPAVTPDGVHLLFASNRPTEEDFKPAEGAWPATLREERELYDYDIYALDLEDAEGRPRRLDAVSSRANDGQPTVSPDGTWLYFASDRDGGVGGYDLWRSRITTKPLAGLLPPANLGAPVNTAANELDPAVSLEGFGLYFSSDRGEEETYAIYYARSREVYPLVLKSPGIGHILGRLSWPLIGLILALAGLGLTLLALAKLHKRPGLLTSAMMISLVVHLVALSLFTLWELSIRVYELVESERFDVSVNIPGLAESELSSELRARLTDLTRLDTAQFAVKKTPALSAPIPPELAQPEVALAAAEPAPRQIEIIRREQRPADLAESLRPELAPAPITELALPESIELLRPKPVRKVEPTEAAPPEGLALVSPLDRPIAHEPAPAGPVKAPPTDKQIRVGAEAIGATPVETPALLAIAPGAAAAEAVRAEPVAPPLPLPGAEAVGPVDLTAPATVAGPREARPAQAPSEIGPRETLMTLRAQAAEPTPALAPRQLGTAVPLAVAAGTPIQKTLLATAATQGAAVATPAIGEAVRVALPPPGAPLETDVVVPPQPLALKQIYGLRTKPDRDKAIEKLGGTPETEEAVRHGLAWLARHQSPDGRWDVDGFMKNYDEKGRRADGGGERTNQDIGVTGLAGLAFVGAGHTHIPAQGRDEPGEYAEVVQKAIDWIIADQKPDGDLRRGGQMYGQAMAAMFLCEAYTMTGDGRLVEPAKKAVQFIIDAQNPGLGWRYEPRNQNDTSVVGWQIMTLKSAEIAGFTVPPKVYRGAANWLDKVRKGQHGGLYEYQPGRNPSPAMTAQGLFTEQYVDFNPDSPRTAESVAYILNHKPRWVPQNTDLTNLYYWYYATLTLHQLGGPQWDEWNNHIRQTLVKGQRKDGPFVGSWDPRSTWGRYGGRVYSTAIATLTLEVYYRYLPFYNLRLAKTAADSVSAEQ